MATRIEFDGWTLLPATGELGATARDAVSRLRRFGLFCCCFAVLESWWLARNWSRTSGRTRSSTTKPA